MGGHGWSAKNIAAERAFPILPALTASATALYVTSNLLWNPQQSFTLRSSQKSKRLPTFSEVASTGFSVKICKPCSAASLITASWVKVGVQTTIPFNLPSPK